MRTKFFCSIAIVCLLLGVSHIAYADTDHLVISQIQTTGGSGKTTNDFVEIYNPTTADIDLKGYRLVKRTKTGTTDTSLKSWTTSAIIPAHGFYLWANSSFTDIAVAADTTTSGSIADDNAVALRLGPNDTGTIIDSIAWGLAANTFVEGSSFPTNPEANQSLERLPGGADGNGTDTNNNATDFLSVVVAHPRNSTSLPVPVLSIDPTPAPVPPPPPSPQPDPAPELINEPIYLKVIFISEILPNPDGKDDGEEWIELTNGSDQAMDLSGWILDDGDLGDAIGSDAYVIAENTSIAARGYLTINLPPESFALNNTGGDTVRLFSPDKKLSTSVHYSDNAKEDKSYAMKSLGNYFWTIQPTKGAANEFEESLSPQVTAQAQVKIKLNEIFPNPVGPDSGGEWVEVTNLGAEPVSLLNWILDDGAVSDAIGSSAYKIPRLLATERSDGGQESVIVPPSGLAVITIPAGKFAINNTGSETVRLFNENKVLIDSITFEGGKEGQAYAWLNNKWIWTDATPNGTNSDQAKEEKPAPSGLIISELYPEPEKGSEEFIELLNTGTKTLDLHDWQVADLSTKYTFHSSILAPGEFYVLKKSESKIALNNSGKEQVSLTDPKGNIVSSIEYEDAPKNASYSLLPDGTFTWSSVATPGAVNVAKVAVATSAKSGKVAGATLLPRTGNDLPVNMTDCFVLWIIIWYIYAKLTRKDESYE